MSATACLRFVPDGCDGPRCWACGDSRAAHEGRVPAAPSQLPSPEMIAERADFNAFEAVRVDRGDIADRLTFLIDALLVRQPGERWKASDRIEAFVKGVSALRDDLRGQP